MRHPHPSVIRRALRGSFLGLLLAAVSASAAAADISLTRVITGWREAASFKRISEYFTGRENTGGQVILRTHPEQRAGYYFLIRTANSGATTPVRIKLQIISSRSAQPVSHRFTTGLKSGDTVLQLGLTGPDWPNPAAEPVAWMLELQTEDGRVLASEKSYLWELPAGD